MCTSYWYQNTHHTCILIKKSSNIQQNDHTSSRSFSPVWQELKELRTIDGDDNRSDAMVKQQGHLGAPGRTRITIQKW